MTEPFHYPEPAFILGRQVVAQLRTEFDALFVCLWLLDNRERPAQRIADPEIPPGTGIALSAGMIAEHLEATHLPVTPLGARVQHGGETLGFLEIHLPQGDAMMLGGQLTKRLDTLAETLAACRTIASVEAPPRGKVLIVDDDETIRRLLKTVLERERFDVIEAPNGLLGCHLAETEQPDLIVMDWTMPLMDGREATLRIKSNPRTLTIPVVMLTSRSHVEDRILALDSGAQDFLTKPFNRRELIAHIERQLRWRHLLATSTDAPPAPSPTEARTLPQVPSAAPSPARKAPEDARSEMDEALSQAEALEAAGDFGAAAAQYHRAAEFATLYVNPDVANKLHRLAGKMYLSWAENATEAADIQRGYAAAARAFLGAGNLKLAKKSADNARAALNAPA